MAGSSYVRPVQAGDIEWVAAHMREADKNEIWAADRHKPLECLQFSVKLSQLCWTGVDKQGIPVIIFGVGAQNMLAAEGSPWMLATDGIYDMWVEFLRYSRYYVEQMTAAYSYLENYVDFRNTVSKRWLKWCGFTIEDPAPFGPDQLPFHRFHMGG